MKAVRFSVRKALTPILAVVAALIVGLILILIEGASPTEAYRILLTSSFSSRMNFGETLIKAIPIGFTGLAVVWAYRGGVFNIGVEGQLLVGAAGGIAVALNCASLPAVIVIPLSLLAGAAAGGLWAYIPALLKAKKNINEIISTIMLNYIGKYFVSWLVNGPLQEAARHNPQT
jgi:simple sugar transport system permease protein